jgi:Cys-rich four helix bundle protein (predicted Tat secretion target)
MIDHDTRSLTRRSVLSGAAGLAAALVAPSIVAAAEHSGHGGHAEGEARYTPGVRNKKHPELIAAANSCLAAGESCISHCMETFVGGDTTMGRCADAVQQMLPVCRAMSSLSVYDSPHLPALAEACIGVCTDCEKVCREHAEHQPECKRCADACAELIAQCKRITA